MKNAGTSSTSGHLIENNNDNKEHEVKKDKEEAPPKRKPREMRFQATRVEVSVVVICIE